MKTASRAQDQTGEMLLHRYAPNDNTDLYIYQCYLFNKEFGYKFVTH